VFFADRLILFPIMFLIYAGLLVLAVWVVLWAIRIAPRGVRPDNSLNILRERFARGEINQEEYEARKSVLTKR
jgi:putative membrane protein